MLSVLTWLSLVAAASDLSVRATFGVGSVQIQPTIAQNGSPSETIAATAQSLLTTLTHFADTNANTTIALFNTPEFLFTGDVDYLWPLVCSDDTSSSGSLRGYCYPIPQVGEPLVCGAEGGHSPADLVGCGLMQHAHLKETAVSINVCEVTPSNGTLFNTQVVVRSGRVIAVYRKYHPFFTDCYSTPHLEVVTFTIADNVTVGIFTCYDILFELPKDRLLQEGVKLFSYSVSMPLIDVVIRDWSEKNSVTVVASNHVKGQTAIIERGVSLASCSAENQTCVAVAFLSM